MANFSVDRESVGVLALSSITLVILDITWLGIAGLVLLGAYLVFHVWLTRARTRLRTRV